VENFDCAHPRDQRTPHRNRLTIYRAYNYAKSIGFPQINIYLIAGLVEETDENWRANVTKTIELTAGQRDHLPNGSALQHGHLQGDEAEGKLTAPFANWHTKRGWVGLRFPRA